MARTLTYTGPLAGDWANALNWSVNGSPAGQAPSSTDNALLGSTATISGNGTPGAIDVTGNVIVNGRLAVSGAGAGLALDINAGGALTLAGTGAISAGSAALVGDGGAARFTVVGNSASSEATVTTLGLSVAGGSETDVSYANWADSGGFTIGVNGAGALNILNGGSISTPTAVLGSGPGSTGELSVGPDGTFSVSGTFTVGDGGPALLIDDGAISAGTMIFGANSLSVLKPALFASSIIVQPGALLTLTNDLEADTNGDPTHLTLNGTLDGLIKLQAVSLISTIFGGFTPSGIIGTVDGSGTALIEPGGALGFAGGSVSGITVTFKPGVGPLYTGTDGSAGGALVLYNPGSFHATVDGFAPGDEIAVMDTNVAGATIVAGNVLDFTNAGGTVLYTVQLNPLENFSTVTPYVTNFSHYLGLTDSLTQTGTTGVMVGLEPSGIPNPILSTQGALRTGAGSSNIIPGLAAFDAYALNQGESYTVQLTAATGSFGEFISLPQQEPQVLDDILFTFLNALAGPLDSLLAPGDGTITVDGSTLSVNGTGTGTITIATNNLFLADFQLSLLTYTAGSINSAITMTATASGSGAPQVSSTIIPVDVTAPATFTLNGNGEDYGTPANWTGASGATGVPGAADTVIFPAGAMLLTGAGDAREAIVQGHVVASAALNLGLDDRPGQTALLVDQGGDLALGGFLFDGGDAVVGSAGSSGTLDLYGLMHVIKGTLSVGMGGPGLVQSDGITEVQGGINLGVSSTGTFEISNVPFDRGFTIPYVNTTSIAVGIGGPALFDDNNVQVVVSGGLNIGDGAPGTLLFGGADADTIIAGLVTVGALSNGTVSLDNEVILSATNIALGLTSGLSGVIGGDGTGTVAASGQIIVGAGGAGAVSGNLFNSGLSTDSLDIAAQSGSAGTVSAIGHSVTLAGGAAVGGTQAGEGGAGTLSATLINIGGPLTVWGGGVVNPGSIQSDILIGGTLMVNAGGFVSAESLQAIGITIAPGGTIALNTFNTFGQLGATTGGGLHNSATIVNNGLIDAGALSGAPGAGSLYATAGTGTIQLENNEDLTLSGQIGSGQTLELPGTHHVVSLLSAVTSTGSLGAAIRGFNISDEIDALNIGNASVGQFNNGTLSIPATGSNSALTLFFPDLPDGTHFNVVTNFSNDTQITMTCYRRGTRLLTDQGERAIEDLRIGDRLPTVDGIARPVIWIGQRTIDCTRHPRPELVWPVRVAAGAFGECVPSRDLYLSPDHAVFHDGVLIPIRLLINGTSVARVPSAEVTYFHVELDEHDVILAEGLAAESYLDVGDRAKFGSEEGTVALFPLFRDRAAPAAHHWETRGRAPLVVAGLLLAAARLAIARRVARVA